MIRDMENYGLEFYYGDIYFWVGGNMVEFNIVVDDFFFWMYYVNVDRIWEF